MTTNPSALKAIINSNRAAQAGAASPATTPTSPLAARRLANGRRAELVDVPGLGQLLYELPGAIESQTIEAEVLKALATTIGPLTILTADRYELERAFRTLARVAREPGTGLPVGTPEDWGQLEVDVIVAAWQVYADVRDRLDPMARPLTEDERIAIAAAVKKKDPMSLRTYGAVKLSDWLATTDVLPSTSPTPSSPSSDSQPAA